MKNCIIYKIIFPNNKVYVGQTTQKINTRFRAHINSAFNVKNKNRNSKVCRAIRKHGKNRVLAKQILKIEIIAYTNPKDLDRLESHYIRKLDSFNSGYNSDLGGGGIRGYRHSRKTKKKIGERTKAMIGENATNNKANSSDVEEMRKMYISGKSASNIQKKFCYLAYSTVYDIVKNKQWKDKEYGNKIIKINRKNKMDAKKAKKVRTMYATGKYKIKDLADIFELSVTAIHNILTNKSWKDKKYKTQKNKSVARKNIMSASKLAYGEIKKIIKMYKNGYTQKYIAKNYKVSAATISGIINGKTWKLMK